MSKEAMKLALEALYLAVRMEPSDSIHECPEMFQGAITALRNELAKQEQGEPVTWRNAAIRVGEDLCSVGPFGYYDMTAEQWLDWALSVVTVHLPQQQRTWVGLTEEEIWQIATDCTIGGDLHADKFAKAIEAKLKEKNT
jgi:hypothetical protein